MKRLDTLLLSAVGIFMGIAFGTFFPSHSFDAIAIGTLFLFACGFSIYGKPFFVPIVFLLLAFCGGIWRGSEESKHWKNLDDPTGSFHGTGTVMCPSVERLFFQESEIRADNCEGDFCPRESILLRESGSKKRMIGDKVELVCDLKKPEEYIEIAGREVAYRMALASRSIGYLCERPASAIDSDRSGDWHFIATRFLFSAKEKIVMSLEQSLPASEAALSLGMLIGADDGFSSVEKNLFIRTGVTHVTAVSGYNITLVGGLLFFLAIPFGLHRFGASLIAIAGIGSYVLLVGAPASAVRAGIMGSLVLLSLLLGRPGSAFRVWFLALSFMLAWSPLLLRYDIGFELSYAATLALLLYAGVREFLRMPKNIGARFLYEMALLSIFVEWLVAPIIILQFGTFSVVSIAANVFLVPLVPFIMLFSFLSSLSGLAISGGVFLFSWPAFFLAHSFIVGARFLDIIPGSFVSDISASLFSVLSWYMVTGFLFWFFLWRKRDMIEEEVRE